jgi:hypothetical protein
VAHGAPRIRAARWVLALGRVQEACLVAGAVWSALGAALAWSPAALLVAAVLAGSATAWAALLRAFAAHRRGAWQLLLGLAAAGLVPALLPGEGPVALLGVLVAATWLCLLLHRDSRAWVAPVLPAGTVRPR